MAGVVVAASFAVLGPCALQANLGSFYDDGVFSSGALRAFEPRHMEAVRIVDENLVIDLGDRAADIEVRYLMRNETGKRVKVRVGFPIEETRAWVPSGNIWLSASAPGYRIAAAGKAIKAKFVAEKEISIPSRVNPPGIAGWMVSEITFGPRAEVPVAVTFSQPYAYDNLATDYESDFGAKIFRYRLSTAAAWAGPIGRGRIELRTKKIDPAEVKVLKPAKRFARQGNAWVWEFENLEPTLADDLEIQAAPGGSTSTTYVDERRGKDDVRDALPDDAVRSTWIERGGRWFLEHQNFRARASSELAAGAANNVRDDDYNTEWIEAAPGPGVGEWLEVRPEFPKPLSAVTLYFRDGPSNPVPKKIRVELNGEHRFTEEVPERGLLRFPVLGYTKPVKTMRIIFEEVRPGEQTEEAGISKVLLEAVSARKPKLGPAKGTQ